MSLADKSRDKALLLIGLYGADLVHSTASAMANAVTQRNHTGLYRIINQSLVASDIAAAFKPWEIEHFLAMLCCLEGDHEAGELHHEMQRRYSHLTFEAFR